MKEKLVQGNVITWQLSVAATVRTYASGNEPVIHHTAVSTGNYCCYSTILLFFELGFGQSPVYVMCCKYFIEMVSLVECELHSIV